MAKWGDEEEVFEDDKRPKEISDVGKEKDSIREKENVDKFIEDARNNKTLKDNDVGVYRNTDYYEKLKNMKFYRTLSVILLFVIIGFGVAYFLFLSNGSLNPNYNSNSTLNINTPNISATTNNSFYNQFYNNQTTNRNEDVNIYINLSKELGSEISSQVLNAIISKFNLNMSNVTI